MSTMRIAIGMLAVGLVSALGVAPGAHAAGLFSFKIPLLERKSATVPERGVHPIELDAALASLQSGARVQMPLPDGSTREVVIDNVFTHPNGDRTWAGYLAAEGTKYRVLLTAGATATAGRILTPEREYGITSTDGSARLVDYSEADVRTFITDSDDVLVPPRPAAARAPSGGGALQPKATGPSTIDVLVLYSTTYANANGGDAGAVTRINSKIALSNQAYIDSGVQLQLRLVGAQPVNYPDSTPIEQTLRELSGVGTTRAAAFAQVPALRNILGADLVSLVRTFNGDTAQSDAKNGVCGLAWAGGHDLTPIQYSSETAYSVVDDGRYGSSQCDDYTFTHELGHNMGSMHDRAALIASSGTLSSGAYPYSFGFGVTNSFTTIMAYRSSFGNAPRIGRFSNPDQSCGASLCGAVPEAPAAADNALSLNNTRAAVANFRASVVTANQIVEFYNVALDHYFMTANDAEKQNVDIGGAGLGWQRTGSSFKSGGSAAVCRFYGNQTIDPATGQPYGPNSHFYTIDPAECTAVKRDPGWTFESPQVFNLTPVSAPQTCPSGTNRIWRTYNDRAAANDSNHRYMSDPNFYNEMIARGWRGEGVVFCAGE